MQPPKTTVRFARVMDREPNQDRQQQRKEFPAKVI
jgi:hypothetical protein